MRPARQVSGDFYDFFLIDADRLGLCHRRRFGERDSGGALHGSQPDPAARHGVHGDAPRECLEHVNRVLLKQSDGEVFLTLLYGIWISARRFEFSVGGQPPPYLLPRSGPGGAIPA